MLNQLGQDSEPAEFRTALNDDVVDVNLMQLAKQNNFLQAFESNLKAKKDEIIRLETEQQTIQNEQETMFVKLLHLKKQRETF